MATNDTAPRTTKRDRHLPAASAVLRFAIVAVGLSLGCQGLLGIEEATLRDDGASDASGGTEATTAGAGAAAAGGSDTGGDANAPEHLPPGSCVPDDRRCFDSVTPEVCSSLGQWIQEPGCFGSSPICYTGECVVCSPKQKKCLGNAPAVCQDDGLDWSVAAECLGATPACITTTGECGRCEEGEKQCSDSDGVQTCKDNGSWGPAAPCGEGTPQCVNGGCFECDPNEGNGKSCEGNTPLVCLNNSWAEETACSGDQPICLRATGSCGCVEKARRCQGATAPQTCSAAGQWINETACSGATPVCNDSTGTCACSQGDRRCNDGDTPAECNANGVWVAQSDCSGSKPICVGAGECAWKAIDISAGWAHSCAVTSVGGIKCWGNDEDGRLGDGIDDSADELQPVDVKSLGGTAVQVSAGYRSTCAVLSNGAVKCWGNDSYGALGDGNPAGQDQHSPALVAGLVGQATYVSTGDYGACALLTSGFVQCWGYTYDGQLGVGTGVLFAHEAAAVAMSDGAYLARGSNHVCVARGTGQETCWGVNQHGQVGTSVLADQFDPVVVAGLGSTTVIGMTAGRDHSCVVFSGGSMRCWGRTLSGALGNGTTTDSAQYTPVTVTAASGPVSYASAGTSYTCAILSAGGVQCWGSMTRHFPETVIDLDAGASHACAILPSGEVRCWGSGGDGRLGNGSTGSATAWVPVVQTG